MRQSQYELLYDTYFPFRLYSDAAHGMSIVQLAQHYGMSPPWIEARIEAARLCIEKQVRITTLDKENAR
jgi:Mor family transcriptional regulator